MPILTPIEAERFNAKLQSDPESGCINWTGAIKWTGYGCFSIKRKLYYVHRLAFERAKGAIPDGLFIDHTCFNRRCVNPSHLQIATAKENAENIGVVRASSGYRGVHWSNRHKQFRVRVKHAGKVYYGGQYDVAEDANEAAIALRNKLFTNNLLDRCEETAQAVK